MNKDVDTPTPLDRLALDLRRLRADAGLPSYAEIVLQISRDRLARGVPPAEARPARTTVYDAFRTGRRRVDVGLVQEIVRALGADETEVARWVDPYGAGRAPQDVLAPVMTHPAMEAAQGEAVSEEVPDPPVEVGASAGCKLGGRRGTRSTLLVLGVCVAVNLLGRGLVDVSGLPLYLDMGGTAFAAVTLGPWWGALVGGLTNIGGVALSGPLSLAFLVVNVAGGLMWGYGARRFHGSLTIPRYFLLNVVVALGCTVVAAPIIVFGLEGVGSNGTDTITGNVLAIGGNLVLAVFSANLMTSLADKLIAGFVTLAVIETLSVPRSAPRGVRSWWPDSGRTVRPWAAGQDPSSGSAAAGT